MSVLAAADDHRYKREVYDSWMEYLRSIRLYADDRIGYELVEPGCWDRLISRLEAAKLAALHRKGTGR